MEYTKLGRTGLYVSRICLGTMNFGSFTDEKEAHKILDAAVEVGINFVDTANCYGFLTGEPGKTEEIIGRWFQKGENRREKIVLATKVYESMNNEIDGPNGNQGLSTYKIRRNLKASLKRLQTDHIELYYMHHYDRNCSWDELWDCFENLYEQNSIDYVGTSNFPAWEIARGQCEADKRHFLGIAAEQDQYSLLSRMIELEVLPACKTLGIGTVAWGSLGGGLLTGSKSALKRFTNTNRFEKEKNRINQYLQLCNQAGYKPAEVATAWTLRNPSLNTVIIGPRTLDQFMNIIQSLTMPLDESFLSELEKIFAGPGGEAPEAYAW